MQEIQLINAGQLFPNPNPTSGAGGGIVIDRRLRQTNLQNQALKCPRCDSLNTKFCYYNNYNLSQPRHFCKSCRRYWTKGGVLRNVPIGGGCRKSSKRSAVLTGKCLDEVRGKPKSNNSNSSSESSSLTGNGNAAVVVNDAAEIEATPAISAVTPPHTEAVSTCFGFCDAKYIFPQIRNPNFRSEHITTAECGGIDGGRGYTDIGNVSNFIAASYDAVSPYDQYDQWQLSTKQAASAGGGHVGPTIQIDQQHQSSNLGPEPLRWHQEENQHEIFGLTSAVDQVYWSQQQWPNPDNAHVYLP